MYAGGECWRWYARGVARQGRPQGADGIERHCRAHGRRRSNGPIGAALQPSGGCGQRPDLLLQQACTRCWPGKQGPRAAHHRDAGCEISTTCCFLQCVAEQLVRSARIRAVLAANRSAAFPELCMPQHCCRSRRLSRLLHRSGENDKRYRRHHPASRPGAVLPVLILINPNNPILQSCTYPIATAVQPWPAQECAYTFWNRPIPAARCPRWLVEPAMPPARRRFQADVATARKGIMRFRFFPSNLHSGEADGDAPV